MMFSMQAYAQLTETLRTDEKLLPKRQTHSKTHGSLDRTRAGGTTEDFSSYGTKHGVSPEAGTASFT